MTKRIIAHYDQHTGLLLRLQDIVVQLRIKHAENGCICACVRLCVIMSVSCDTPLAHRWLIPPSTVQEGGGGARTQGTGYRWHRGHRQADCMARWGEGTCVCMCAFGKDNTLVAHCITKKEKKGISLVTRSSHRSLSLVCFFCTFSTGFTSHSLSLSHVTSSDCRIRFRCHALFDIQQWLIPICSLISTDTTFIITHTFDCFIRKRKYKAVTCHDM